MPTDPAARLAQHAAAARFEHLPAATIAATTNDLLDTLGCALGGSGEPGIDTLLRLHRRWGGAPEAGLLLVGGRLPAPNAAFLHAAMAHALDFDDTFDAGGSIHPGASVLGAVLATADMLGGTSGKNILLAAALGLDISCRIALAATVDRGWHRTAAIGVFGAAIAAGKLLGLTAGQFHHALGIAYSQAAGNRQCILDGALTKRFQAGQAASAGVLAALLAHEGFTGAAGIFAGRFGFMELYQPGGHNLAPLTDSLGEAWRGDAISFKPYPCGRPQHALIDAALALRATIGIQSADDIAEITAHIPAALAADKFAGPPHERAPTQIVEAQFALPFLLATALVRGQLGIGEVANLADAPVLAIAARIQAAPDTGKPRLTARHRDGCTATVTTATPLGAPTNPLTQDQLIAKFRDCAAHAVRPLPAPTVTAAIDDLMALPTLPDIRTLLHRLA